MIFPGSNYGDIRKQASRDPTPHGLTPSTIEDLASRFENFVPGLASSKGTASRQFFDGLLPDGAELDPRIQKQANYPACATFAGGNERGASKSFLQPQALTPVPVWATTFDFSGIMNTGMIEFFNSTGASVGIISAEVVSNFSVPDGAATFTLTTGDGGFVVFRQQG